MTGLADKTEESIEEVNETNLQELVLILPWKFRIVWMKTTYMNLAGSQQNYCDFLLTNFCSYLN